jgi:hypothetical protein
VIGDGPSKDIDVEEEAGREKIFSDRFLAISIILLETSL